MKPLTEEQRELVQAVLDGKTLQGECEPITGNVAASMVQAIYWVVMGYEVRIKPEPEPEPRKVTRWLHHFEGGSAAVSDYRRTSAVLTSRIRIDYYPDEPDPAKRVTATLEDVK